MTNDELTPDVIYLRNCPKCGRETNNYAYCDWCVQDAVESGVSVDDLWEVEVDAFHLSGLAKLVPRVR